MKKKIYSCRTDPMFIEKISFEDDRVEKSYSDEKITKKSRTQININEEINGSDFRVIITVLPPTFR